MSTTVTPPSSSPSLSSPSPSPSPPTSTSSPPSNYCDQDANFIINNNHIHYDIIGNGSNDNNVNYINNLNNTGIADFNIINVNDNLVASHKLNQQTIIQNNFFSACHQSSSASDIYALVKGNQNQLSLNINNADNISNDDSIVEDNKIIVPAQHHQQPIESINNDNDINIISQNHQLQIQQLQLHQQQSNKFFHHDHIPQVHPNHQLITRNSTPNFHSTIDSNKMFKQFQVDKENPNIQSFTKALDNNITQNIGNNVDSNNAGNPIFVIDHSNNCFTTLSTPNTPTFPPPGQINNGVSNNGNNNSINYPPPSSALLKPPNQVPRKGHTRKRSLSAPTIPSEIQDSLVVPSSSSYYQQQQQQHHQYYNYHNHLYQQQQHHYPINCSPFIGKPNVLVPIQRNPKNLSQSSQPPMSSEEYRHKLNEELEKVDFSDITVSELKNLLRQRNKPATGKKAILMERLQEEIKLVKAIKNNKGGTGNSNDNNSSDSKDVNNNNTGDNTTSGNNVDDNHIVNNVNATNNNTNNTDDNDKNKFDQQQQQQQQPHQPMTTSSTITNNKMLDHDVMTINHNSNNNTTTKFSSLPQQLNIDDSSNTISLQGFFFQNHPMSAPAIKTEFFASLGDSNNNNDTSADNDDDIVIKDEEMSNVNNSGDVAAVNGYDTYHHQPSSAPSMMTEFNNNYGFINHQISNKNSLSSMDDGNDDSQMMMSNDPNDPTSPVSTASLLLNDPLRMFVSSPLQHHYNEEAFQFIFNQNQQQILQDDGILMNIKTEEDNLGYFTTPYTLTQQVEDIVMVGGMV